MPCLSPFPTLQYRQWLPEWPSAVTASDVHPGDGIGVAWLLARQAAGAPAAYVYLLWLIRRLAMWFLIAKNVVIGTSSWFAYKLSIERPAHRSDFSWQSASLPGTISLDDVRRDVYAIGGNKSAGGSVGASTSRRSPSGARRQHGLLAALRGRLLRLISGAQPGSVTCLSRRDRRASLCGASTGGVECLFGTIISS